VLRVRARAIFFEPSQCCAAAAVALDPSARVQAFGAEAAASVVVGGGGVRRRCSLVAVMLNNDDGGCDSVDSVKWFQRSCSSWPLRRVRTFWASFSIG
jgi:hypothetical protein